MGATLSDWRQGCHAVKHGEMTCQRTANLLRRLAAAGCCDERQAVTLLLAADRLCALALRLLAAAGLPLTIEMRQLVPLYLGYRLANELTDERHSWLAASHHAPVTRLIDNLWQCLAGARPAQGSLVVAAGEQQQFCDQLKREWQRVVAAGVNSDESLVLAQQYVHQPLPGEQLVVYLGETAAEAPWLPAVASWWRGEDTGLVLPQTVMLMDGSGGQQSAGEALQHSKYLAMWYEAGDPAACLCALVSQADQLRSRHQQVMTGVQSYPLMLPLAVAYAGNNGRRPVADDGDADLVLHAPVMPMKAVSMSDSLSAVALPALPAFWSLQPGELMAPLQTIDFWFQYLVETNFCWRPRMACSGDLARALFANSFASLHYRDNDPLTEGRVRSGCIVRSADTDTLLAPLLANRCGINLLLLDASCNVDPALKRQTGKGHMHSGRHWLNLPVVIPLAGGEPVALAESWLRQPDSHHRVFYPWDANSAVMTMNQMFREHGQFAAVLAPTDELPACCTGRQAHAAVEHGAVLLAAEESPAVELLAVGAAAVQAACLSVAALRRRGHACTLLAILEPKRFLHAGFSDVGESVENRLFVTHTDSPELPSLLSQTMPGLQSDKARWLILRGAEDAGQYSRNITEAAVLLV